ncbi:sensor domain-containing diguanylate cyclase [Actinoplanes sp. Pm04-4]|uniref:Sensor domain-containing diguanylate cyclase n=1 Tax=Paractinoplanes pyxinae TaxID=2997416 RepID=A0ABT4ASB0_9ACTN|nr:sensor domain-containing diguanylate cyclase [Actinoplanes pyxinae]MCY1137129.1 sensor domain-containing diguanylate cyclase [Actinoplanes pyxinae]
MRRGRGWAGLLLVVAVLITGGAVTVAAYDIVDDGEDRYAGQVMDRYAAELSAAVGDRAARYTETVSDLAAAVGAQSDLRGDDFVRMTATLDGARLPGAAGISFVVAATGPEVPALQRFWRARGASELKLLPATGTSTHDFVVFERTFDSVTNIVGVDLAQRPQAGEALRTAQASGRTAISPAYYLIRDDNLAPGARQTSISFVAPVYSGLGSSAPDVFRGWIVMPVRGQDFVARTLHDRGQGAVQTSLAEGTGAHAVLATAAPGRRVADESLVRQRALTVGQRHWELTLWPTTRLINATDRGMSRFTLAAGAALTVLLCLMTAVLTGSRNRALLQVDQATTALRKDIARREDVEARLREREQELHHLAFHDPLTGLANRLLFYDRLTHAVATRGRTGGRLAVLFIDLDGFKEVNDRLGHNAGDLVLRTVGDRLRTSLRAADTVARFGGDEFAVILEDIESPADARSAAERVIAGVRAPIDVNGEEARVSASIGIAVSDRDSTADDLVGQADAAMYAAKNAGKNRYVAT